VSKNTELIISAKELKANLDETVSLFKADPSNEKYTEMDWAKIIYTTLEYFTPLLLRKISGNRIAILSMLNMASSLVAYPPTNGDKE